MLEFGAALPRIRQRVAADLAAPVGSRPAARRCWRRSSACSTRRYVRVGNEEYARENKSFGLTTLRNRHAAVVGRRLRLRFRGKSGKEHEVASTIRASPASSGAARRCRARSCSSTSTTTARARRRLGRRQRLHPRRERRRLHRQGLPHLDGTAHALALWLERAARRRHAPSAKELIAEVAQRLGNTIAVCKKSYIHPRVLEALAREFDEELVAQLERRARRAGPSAGERRLLAFLGRP